MDDVCDFTKKQMRVQLLQLHSLFVQLSGTLLWVLGPARSQLLHHVFAVGSQVHDDRTILRVVESVHRVGCHVQQAVLVLKRDQAGDAWTRKEARRGKLYRKENIFFFFFFCRKPVPKCYIAHSWSMTSIRPSWSRPSSKPSFWIIFPIWHQQHRCTNSSAYPVHDIPNSTKSDNARFTARIIIVSSAFRFCNKTNRTVNHCSA